jgi:hypothetical protein
VTRAIGALGAALALAACGGDDRSLLERSCDGEAVPNCRAYEYAVVTAASMSPEGVLVSDSRARVTIHVELDTCGSKAPSAHRVRVAALGPSTAFGDGGSGGMTVIPLDDLADDGTSDGDPAARDGVIDATVDNPFFGDVPDDTSLRIRFEPRIDTCAGEALEIDYRVGPRWMPDPGP